METVARVAPELSFWQTEKTIRAKAYQNHAMLIEVVQG